MSPENRLSALAQAQESVNASSKARERLALLFDKDTFVELDTFAKADGEETGVVTGYGAVDGSPVFAFAQDKGVLSGAVGRVHAAKIKKVYDLALKTGAPVVGIYDSNGARLSEGNDALAAYGQMLLSSNNLSGVVPQISLVLGTCAGTAAMIACSADFVVMSKQAELFMTAPFTAKANGETVEGVGTAENAAKAGVAHLVCEDDASAIESTRGLIARLPLNNLSTAPISDFAETDAAAALQAACENIENADIDAIVANVVDANSVIELDKEFGKAALTALVTVSGISCGVVATRIKENDGKLDKDAVSKIARFVSVCDSFALPVVTFVDTKGFSGCAAEELAGGIREAAKLAHVYAEATCAKVSIILGDAYGPAYIALAGKNANADIVYAWPSAVISALAPETAANIFEDGKLKNSANPTADRAQMIEDYKKNQASPFEAAAGGHIDNVIDPANTRAALISAVELLSAKRESRLPKKHSNMPM